MGFEGLGVRELRAPPKKAEQRTRDEKPEFIGGNIVSVLSVLGIDPEEIGCEVRAASLRADLARLGRAADAAYWWHQEGCRCEPKCSSEAEHWERWRR